MTGRQHVTGHDPLARFLRAAAATPDRPAVRFRGADVTFAQLADRVTALASALRERGVRRGDHVGVCLERGVDLVTALLAAWSAGAAYVPLDPRHPDERIALLIRDCGPRLVVAADDRPTRLAGVEVIAPCAAGPATAPVPVTPADAAYVIYTSGSTGVPKGVVATRGGVASLLHRLEAVGAYPDEHRVVGWNASASFDASVQQWARICRGDTIVVLDEEERRDPARFGAALAAYGITDVDATPSHWEAVESGITGSSLRLFLGGEPVSPALWRRLAEAGRQGRVEAYNLYGPTECTVDSTIAPIEGDEPHIGPPLPDVEAHVLDDRLVKVPVGVTGELYLAGDAVARGYAGRPGLTAERFVADPFAGGGGRMYRTGDEVRWRADGALEFVGRADRQVKVRGFRIEPGEIEAAVAAYREGCAAVVVARADDLVAYCVGGVDLDALRAHLAARLPAHLVPARLVPVAAFPLTVNGKIDLAGLPDPDAGRTDGRQPEGRYEELVAGVWADVLGRDRVFADDDFFALGAHSLMAIRVVARVKKELDTALSIRDVYRRPLLRDFAEFVRATHVGAAATAER
ncbi:non-ribosomal peptide synthetase [Streptomyces sp. MMBL 11-3]|uniref:non-ribosomal peptide synthetase n=1 Tax=Streptomyces sp. MMBL 11-3 TaxID=3382639 RepID=UPI0039B5C8B7